MTTSTQISAQAAAWISRLNADDRTEAVDAACREWLSADPRHRAAFEIANRMWEDASTLPVSLAARIGRRDLSPAEFAPLPARSPSRPVLRWAAAAGVAVAVFAGALLYTQRPQVFETRTGQQLTVPLEDGSRLILNTDTRARVRFGKQARRIELESGEALFDVARDSARPFVVIAGSREITALGTRFVVRRDERQVAVTLMDGKVAVSDVGTPEVLTSRGAPLSSVAGRGQEPRILTAGQRLTLIADKPARLDEPRIDAVTAWRKGEIVFENTPLATAIEEMNRYSVRKLKLDASAPAHMPVSGLFRSGDADNFALALTTTHPLVAVEDGGAIEIRAR